MQALGLVKIFKKQNLIEISFVKISKCKKMGLGRFKLGIHEHEIALLKLRNERQLLWILMKKKLDSFWEYMKSYAATPQR